MPCSKRVKSVGLAVYYAQRTKRWLDAFKRFRRQSRSVDNTSQRTTDSLAKALEMGARSIHCGVGLGSPSDRERERGSGLSRIGALISDRVDPALTDLVVGLRVRPVSLNEPLKYSL